MQYNMIDGMIQPSNATTIILGPQHQLPPSDLCMRSEEANEYYDDKTNIPLCRCALSFSLLASLPLFLSLPEALSLSLPPSNPSGPSLPPSMSLYACIIGLSLCVSLSVYLSLSDSQRREREESSISI